MSTFEWKPGEQQTYDLNADTKLYGSYDAYAKQAGSGLTLDTAKSLTLCSTGTTYDSGMARAEWQGEFHLIKGTLSAGTKESPLFTVTCLKEAHYSNPNYSMFRSRANFDVYANVIDFGNGNKNDDPSLSFFGNSRTNIFQVDPTNLAWFDGSVIQLENSSEFTVTSVGWCQFDGGGLISLINDSKLAFYAEKLVITDFTFSLGGFKNEHGDANVQSATVSFVGTDDAYNLFDFVNKDYHEGIFNFVTKDDKGNPISNKGVFFFGGGNMGNAFQKDAMLDKKLITIDGIPVTDYRLIPDDWSDAGLFIHLK